MLLKLLQLKLQLRKPRNSELPLKLRQRKLSELRLKPLVRKKPRSNDLLLN